MGEDANDAGLSRRHLDRALEASLRRLGVDTIDLYQPHAWDPLTPIEETLRVLRRRGPRRQGALPRPVQLHRLAGPEDGRRGPRTSAWPRPVTLQPQYNLLAREIEWEIVPAAQDAGLGLLPWSPLGGGWLTGKYTRDQRPTGSTRLGDDPDRGVEAYDRRGASERTWAVIDASRSVAEERGVPMGRVALAWLHDRPAVTSVILGARTIAQLDRQPRCRRPAPHAGGDRPAGRRQRPGPGRLPLRRRSASTSGSAWSDRSGTIRWGAGRLVA